VRPPTVADWTTVEQLGASCGDAVRVKVPAPTFFLICNGTAVLRYCCSSKPNSRGECQLQIQHHQCWILLNAHGQCCGCFCGRGKLAAITCGASHRNSANIMIPPVRPRTLIDELDVVSCVVAASGNACAALWVSCKSAATLSQPSSIHAREQTITENTSCNLYAIYTALDIAECFMAAAAV
jgi:hypothetical protein